MYQLFILLQEERFTSKIEKMKANHESEKNQVSEVFMKNTG